MSRKLLLIAAAVAAVVVLAWLTRGTPGTTPAPRTAVGTPAPPRPASMASGFAAATAGGASQGPPVPAREEGAPPVPVPAEVQEAAEERQDAKITRGMQINPGGGIRIESAPPGSPASQMHLQPGDVLKTADNEPLSSPEDFARIYRAQGLPGEIVVIRDGRELHRR